MDVKDPQQYNTLLQGNEGKKDTLPWLKQKASSKLTKKTLYKRIPVLGWAPKYDKAAAVGDILAGVTVGLMVIPQALAYSGIAGLPPQYGLYGSFIGAIVYIFFGSCKDVPMGPTAISALLTFQSIKGMGPEHAVLLCFFTGLVQFVMGIFGLGTSPLTLIGAVPAGLPSLQPPPFGGYNRIENNTEVHVPFVEMMANLSTGIIVTPLIGLLETIAICKAFSDGKPVDATQELIAIGLANIANSFVHAFPGAGALARAAVNNSSGVKTPLGGLYTGILVILALLFFTPFFYYIPKAALAAIIIAAVIFMVEVRVVKPMWRSKKSDLFLGVCTFVACLVLPLEVGILVGIGLNVLFILYHAARPKISIERLTTSRNTEYLMITPDRCLIFPSTDYVRNLVTKHSIRQGIPVVIDCSHIYGADYTAATVVETITKDFALRNQPLFFYNLKPSVSAVFEGLSPQDFVVYYDHDQLDDLLEKQNAKKTDTNNIV
ncbi:hypothetical protein YQE_07474, partial [Dendroctonus ponderosae]